MTDREQNARRPRARPSRAAMLFATWRARCVSGKAARGWPPAVGVILLVWSAAGVMAALVLASAGQGHLALRVLAGNVILATALLLVL